MFIFEVTGKPVPQKQTQFNRFSGHAYDPSSKDKEFIQWQIKPFAPQTPLLTPIELDIWFYLPIPEATSGIRRRQMLNQVIHHTKRPDVDNLGYLVTNALKQIVYADDSQITDLHLHKRFGEVPKTAIKVRAIEEGQKLECA